MPKEEVAMEKTVKVKHITPAKQNKQNSNEFNRNLCRLRPTNFILGLLIVGITSVVIGFGLGYVTAPKPLPPAPLMYIDVPCPTLETMPTPIPKLRKEEATMTPTTVSLPVDEEPVEDITTKLIESINTDRIKDMFKRLTINHRFPGTYSGKEGAELIHSIWERQGLDSSKVLSYDVTLSYPISAPNQISLWSGNTLIWQSHGEELPTGQAGFAINIRPPFNAYSLPGVKQGSVMYVNYGRVEDFYYINRKYGHQIKENTMFMARLGKISIRDKVKNSEVNRGIGLILYEDVVEHTEFSPNAYWANPSTIARGTLLSPDYSGDPSTPGYPSIAGAYRINNTDFGLPTIPALTISSKDAKRILSELSGPKVPNKWKGKLDVKYRIGLGFTENSWFAKLQVKNRLDVSPIHNVIATIQGSIEPDRFVVIGAHRDAWVNGASDSGSSTTSLLTVSQAFADVVKSGWRPRRTIVFCSWDAELHGQIGSTEFAEQFRTILNDRAISYLNVNSVKGNFTLEARSSPLLRDVIFKSAEKISDPDGIYDNMFDLWNDRFPDVSTGLPKMKSLRADNDVNVFANRIGIASMDISYSNEDFQEVPVIHTSHDNFNYVSKFIDPSFILHKTLSETLCEIVRAIADSDIIPFNATTYANQIEENLADLQSSYGEEFHAQGVTFDFLEASVNNFSRIANEFQERITQLALNTSEIPFRIINDQLLALERAMTDPRGLPGRQHITHVISGYANDGKSSNNGGFPGIKDALAGIDTARDVPERWRTVKHHMTVITHTINSAIDTIRDVTSFMF